MTAAAGRDAELTSSEFLPAKSVLTGAKSMNELLRTILTGGIAGGIFSLIAVGLVVTFSVTGIFDLGYGGIAFSAALVFFELNTGLGWNRFVAAAFVVLVLCPMLGLFLNVAVYRPLAHANETVKLVTSVGVLVALPALTQFVIQQGIDSFGWSIPVADEVTATPGVVSQPATNWTLPGNIIINSNQVTVLALGLLVCGALWIMFRSRLGLQMRAVRDRRELAALRGVSERRTTLVAAVLGSMLAGIAGVAGAPILSTLNVGVFTVALLTAAAAVVIGRFRSVPWTCAGGIVLGVLVNLMFRYVHIKELPQLNQAAPFIVLLVGLVLLGRSKVRVAGTASTERVRPDWRADLTTFQRLRIPLVACAVFLYLAYFHFGDYWATLTLRSLAIAIILLSLTVVTGIGGLVSLAQAALASMAALTTALLMADRGWPFLLAGLVGILAAVALGLLVALPSLRLGGVPFALATLALALMAQTLLLNSDYMTNRGLGWLIKRPALFGLDLKDDRIMIVIVAVILALLIWMVSNLRRSASGRSLLAVRATQAASDSLGISAPASRLRLFAVASAMAGLGGVILVLVEKGASGQSIPPLAGLMWLTVVVVVGVDRPAAAVLGGLGLVLFPGLMGAGFTTPFDLFTWNGLESAYLPAILFGLGAIDLARNPDGILDRVSRTLYLRRVKRRGRDEEVRSTTAPAVPSFIASIPTAGVVPVAGEVALRVADVHSGYDLVEVLHGVGFVAPKGKVTVILGANGAGKTTMCKTIVGLLPTTSGTVTLDGADLPPTTPQRCAAGVVLVPETRGIFPGLSVADNLRLSLPDAADRTRATDRFPVLATRGQVVAGALSGGEQQMLSLAAAVTDPPALLIVDEPTLGLAPMIADSVLELLKELSGRGTTVLIAEEKQHTVSTVADHVVLMALGRTIWQGPPSLIPAELLAAAYGLHADLADADTSASAAEAVVLDSEEV